MGSDPAAADGALCVWSCSNTFLINKTA